MQDASAMHSQVRDTVCRDACSVYLLAHGLERTLRRPALFDALRSAFDALHSAADS